MILRAGEGEFVRMDGQCGKELGWVELDDGGRLGRGPAPLTLLDPMEPAGAAEPAAAEADWGAGLLAGREGGVDIWFCGGMAACDPD